VTSFAAGLCRVGAALVESWRPFTIELLYHWPVGGSHDWRAARTMESGRSRRRWRPKQRRDHRRRLGKAAMATTSARLLATRRAFDAAAADYDGPSGNNLLIQRMRAEFWRVVTQTFPPGTRLLDVGCGTGLDAAFLADCGYKVVATDWSPAMVDRTYSRVASRGLAGKVRAEVIGAHELDRLAGQRFDGIYSNLGPLNCTPDLSKFSRDSANLLAAGGHLIVTVIGRYCPWEIGYFVLRGDRRGARRRLALGFVPVGLQGETVWTRYLSPKEFYRAFAGEFALESYRGVSLFLPPPYLIGWYHWLGPARAVVGWLDDHLGGLPALRDLGDHFLMVLTKRE
jgi:SAM-dependent methyltransferase